MIEPISIPIPPWDGLAIHSFEDQTTGARIIIAIHCLRGDRAIGGTRMKSYETLEEAVRDAQRLAEGMTYKWAGIGIEAGGAKAVIDVRPLQEQERADLLVRYGVLLSDLDVFFATGPDLGTSSSDMDLIARGAPDRSFGRTKEAGGADDPAPFTARGVFEAMRVTAEYLWDKPDLAGRTVVLQGFGHVGRRLADLLIEAGCNPAFSDLTAEARQAGIDRGLPFIEPETLFETRCDIFAPCAVGGVINANTIPRLRCSAVVGAANNQLNEAADAEQLRQRGILYAPDFIANCGGAIALPHMELDGWTAERTMNTIVETVHANLRRIYAEAESSGISTDEVARRMAQASIDQEGREGTSN